MAHMGIQWETSPYLPILHPSSMVRRGDALSVERQTPKERRGVYASAARRGGDGDLLLSAILVRGFINSYILWRGGGMAA